MSKIVTSFVFLCLLAVFNCEVQVSTKLTVVKDGSIVHDPNSRLKTVRMEDLTPDDGKSNWGDVVFRQRQDEDVLLLRDLLIYPEISSNDQTLRYSASFSYVKSITSVRAINIGRERAFATEIDVNGGATDIYIIIPAEADPRLLIEVYGYRN